MLKKIKDDISAYGMGRLSIIKGFLTQHCFICVLMHRIGNYFATKKIPFFPDYIAGRIRKRFACEISSYANIGGGFKILHSPGIVIGHQVIIGKNCEIFQNVTIGSNRKLKQGREMPSIGDNVIIYAGAVVVGGIKIGNNVVIGANSYVDYDVSDFCVVKK